MPAHAIRAPFARTVRLGRLDDHRLAALAGTGDERAFEALYERHHRALLGFCRHLLHSREEGEDALQQTFLRAHRSLVQHGPPEDVRPWLFAIARNRCRTIAASRRSAEVPDDELEPATEGLGPEVQRRDDLRALLADLGRLPEDQRAALVLGELGDLSHAEIGTVIGVPAAKVKALVFQARSRLIADREARDTSCADIRMQLATARGGELRRGPLRRHLKECAPCRKYRSAISEQRAALALLLPVLPTAGLKATVLGAAGGGAGGGAAAAVGTGAGAATGGFSGGSFGLTGIGAKLAVGATLVGGAGGGAILVEQSSHGERAEGAAAVVAAPGLAAPPERAEAVTVADSAGGAGEERGTAGARGRERAAEARERAQRRRAAAERKRAKEKAAKRAERRRKAKKQKRAKAAPPAYGRTAQPAKPLTPGADRPATQPSAPRAVAPAARQAPVVRLPRPAKPPVVLPDPPVGPAKAFAPAKAPKAKLAP